MVQFECERNWHHCAVFVTEAYVRTSYRVPGFICAEPDESDSTAIIKIRCARCGARGRQLRQHERYYFEDTLATLPAKRARKVPA